jgi:hypothetical protein
MTICRVVDHQGNSRSAGDAYNQAKDAKNQAQDKARGMKGDAKNQASSHAGDMDSARDPNASFSEQKDQLTGAAQSKANEANQNTPDMDQDQAKDQARGKVNDLKNRIPEEHRQKVSNAVGQTKGVLNDAFPEERREQFIYRLKKVSLSNRRSTSCSSTLSGRCRVPGSQGLHGGHDLAS